MNTNSDIKYSKADKVLISCDNGREKPVFVLDSVTTIGKSAFLGCKRLKSIYTSPFVKTIEDNAFYLCAKLSNLGLYNGLKTIGNAAFAYCSSLTDLAIPKSVTSIGSDVFEGCTSLTYIHIPENIKHIGSYVFAKSGLRRVYMWSLTPQKIDIDPDAFKDLDWPVTLYVPRAAFDLYNNNPVFRDFDKIIPI